MAYLLITSLLWALSFGLVKGQLQGIDPIALSTLRLLIAALIFLPLLRPANVGWPARLRLAAVGAIQFGLMYILYLKAYAYLAAFEVALCTIFTPLYVVLIDAVLERKWQWRYLSAAILAALGAAVLLDVRTLDDGHLHGFLLMQGSNLCFALGQLFWKKEHRRLLAGKSDAQLFAIPYLGALATTLVASCFMTDWGQLALTGRQIACVIYLGAIASGLCFFLWNVGAARVNTGLLAVMNNGKIPIAVAVSLLVFGEKATLWRLLTGGVIIGAGLWLARKTGSATQAADAS